MKGHERIAQLERRVAELERAVQRLADLFPPSAPTPIDTIKIVPLKVDESGKETT